MDYKSLSLANQVYQTIERNILNGVYEQGEIISETKLSAELGVSRTPIREAIARLTNEKLIGVSPAGTYVIGISEQDVFDMFAVKSAIEPKVFRLAAAKMSEEELTQVADIVEQQEFYLMKGNVEKIRNLDTELHDLVYRLSGSTIFESVLSPLHHKLMKYRRDSLRNSGRTEESVKEHAAILQAMKDRNYDKVEELALAHIEAAFRNIEANSEK